MLRTLRNLLKPAVILLFLATAAFGTCTNPITADPTSVNFGNVGVGLGLYGAHGFELTNHCNQTVTINSLTFSPPVFGLADGVLPRYLTANATDNWSMAFRPAAAQSYTGTMTINIAGFPSVVVNLTGTGVANAGVASLSTRSINFGNVPVGSTVSQNVTLTNAGTATFYLTQVNTYAPFQAPPITKVLALGPGKTYTFAVSYTATAVGPVIGGATLVYNFLPAQGIDLTATGTAPTSVALSSFTTLPGATQGAAYLATLQATGGTPPYTFHITKGGTIVPGLTFSSATGTFGGTVASTAAIGNYTLPIQVDDSNKRIFNTTVTLPVGPPTGASCNIIDFDVPETTTPMTALNDLGTGTYDPFGTGCPEPEGCEGGLYPGGSNIDPPSHAADGVTIGKSIQPRDADGNIDPTNGSIVFMGMGESATQQPFNDFMNSANGDPQRNPKVAIVNGALGDETAANLCSSSAGYLSTVLNYVLPFYGYTAQQVAAVWLDTINSGDTTGFSNDATTLRNEFTGESLPVECTSGVLAGLKANFPNLVLTYIGSVNYTGYAEGVSTVAPEPQSYDGSWGDKWAIEEQINGTCCNYIPGKGAVVAPWIGWGYYYWANGLLARQDGTYWSCQDLSSDGTHPIFPNGHLKIDFGLLDFLKTDPTATPWFVAPGGLSKQN